MVPEGGNGPTVSEPEVAFAPDQSSSPLHEVAPVEVQFSKTDFPLAEFETLPVILTVKGFEILRITLSEDVPLGPVQVKVNLRGKTMPVYMLDKFPKRWLPETALAPCHDATRISVEDGQVFPPAVEQEVVVVAVQEVELIADHCKIPASYPEILVNGPSIGLFPAESAILRSTNGAFTLTMALSETVWLLAPVHEIVKL